MTAAPAETVCAPPAMNRNFAIGAVPAKTSPAKRNPVLDMKELIVTKKNVVSQLPDVDLTSRALVLQHFLCHDFYIYFPFFGRVTVILVPLFSSLIIPSVPPRNPTPCFTIESPSPVPPISLEWLLSTR